MASTRAFHDPLGASTSTTSPTAGAHERRAERRIRRDAADRGDLDLHLVAVLVRDLTIEPTPTCSSVSCSTVTAWCRRSRSVRMRASSRPCSFFAAWYSKFSERSPNSRAVLIAWTAAFRRGPFELGELRLQRLALFGGQVLCPRLAHGTER